MFRDRVDAANQLAERLSGLKQLHPLILAIPRGGVPMGKVLAEELDGELNVVLVRKIPAPGNPEYAIGAVSEDGAIHVTENNAQRYGRQYIDRQAEAEQEVLRRRRESYTQVRPPIDPAGCVVVVVDDGSATGATMEVALQAVRQKGPDRLIAALGAAPPDAVERLQAVADEVVCLHVTPHFGAVGRFFRDFSQVSDDEVIALLSK